MYLLFAVAYVCVACDNPTLIPFSNINSISMSVTNSNFTLVVFKHASNASRGIVTKYAG